MGKSKHVDRHEGRVAATRPYAGMPEVEPSLLDALTRWSSDTMRFRGVKAAEAFRDGSVIAVANVFYLPFDAVEAMGERDFMALLSSGCITDDEHLGPVANPEMVFALSGMRPVAHHPVDGASDTWAGDTVWFAGPDGKEIEGVVHSVAGDGTDTLHVVSPDGTSFDVPASETWSSSLKPGPCGSEHDGQGE